MKKRYEFFAIENLLFNVSSIKESTIKKMISLMGLIKITVNILLLLLFVKEFFIYIRDQCNSNKGLASYCMLFKLQNHFFLSKWKEIFTRAVYEIED